jgi:hypothetical protein
MDYRRKDSSMSKGKITVHVSIWFEYANMASTDEAMECVKSVMTSVEEDCASEFKQALEDAGAKNVSVHMLAY